MTELEIKKTPSTPKVWYSSDEATLRIEGRSFPENARDFYGPIIQWIESNTSNLGSLFTVSINLEYYNTASSKFLMEISLLPLPMAKAALARPVVLPARSITAGFLASVCTTKSERVMLTRSL